ncbi:hypothetical protein PGTUg99_012109 [Puccinia graminis f. sp. tritici]|uniref:Uncharacterized protein n=1 Tax=Puccinia graminis f. sp. tritici TaxID=56615 RepID=A0A5B0Q0X2_PUCGR|nr:hypothetical protein PGTUg99_012109 [Puccinia graminis f. sp. tritici]
MRQSIPLTAFFSKRPAESMAEKPAPKVQIREVSCCGNNDDTWLRPRAKTKSISSGGCSFAAVNLTGAARKFDIQGFKPGCQPPEKAVPGTANPPHSFSLEILAGIPLLSTMDRQTLIKKMIDSQTAVLSGSRLIKSAISNTAMLLAKEDEEEKTEPKRGGSVKGRSRNLPRDFAGGYQRLFQDYFSD